MASRDLTTIGRGIVTLVDVVTRSVIVITLSMMLFVICLQVFCRFVLGQALPWPEEASRFLMIWSLFLAAVYVHAEDGHLRLNFFVEKLPPGTKLILRILLDLGILFFLFVMLKGGIFEVNALKVMKTGALRISRAYPYASIPVSAALFILVTLRLMVKNIKKGIEIWRSSS
jgi:TRAP-type C4-dicarboxylate transport system permease small subunit